MDVGDLDINCVSHLRRDMLNSLSHSFPIYVPALSPSPSLCLLSVTLSNMHEPATRHVKPLLHSHNSPHIPPPHSPTTRRCYNPTVSNLSVSRTTLTRHSPASPPSSTKPPLISFHRPLNFTPSRVV